MWNSTLSSADRHWQSAEVVVPRGYQTKLVFEAVMDGEDSDMAIDDVQLLNCGSGELFLLVYGGLPEVVDSR